MKKMIIIGECFQCQYVFKDYTTRELICDRKEKVIPNGFKIPGWCPLPNTTEGEKKNEE